MNSAGQTINGFILINHIRQTYYLVKCKKCNQDKIARLERIKSGQTKCDQCSQIDCAWCGNKFTPSMPKNTICNDCKKLKKCACGCGQLTKTKGSKYVVGHAPNSVPSSGIINGFKIIKCLKPACYLVKCVECNNRTTEYITKLNQNLVECRICNKTKCVGCGELFVSDSKGNTVCSGCKKPIECACGCGEILNKYSRRNGYKFKRGHCICKKCGEPFIHPTTSAKKYCDDCLKPHKCGCSSDCDSLVYTVNGIYAEGHHPNSRPSSTETSKRLKKQVRNGTWVNPNSSKEARKKISQASCEYFSDPEHRALSGILCKKQRNKQSSTEAKLYAELDNRVFKYSGLDTKKEYGQPISADIIAPKVKLIVQVDGCYWHACPYHHKFNKKEKQRIRERDRTLTKKARKDGWTVIRVWEHRIKSPIKLEETIIKINDIYQSLLNEAA